MSKDVDRAQVLKTTKVLKPRKNDGSWIHKSNQEKERAESAAETGPAPRKKSYVSSTAKIFENKSPYVILTYKNGDLAQRLHRDNRVQCEQTCALA